MLPGKHLAKIDKKMGAFGQAASIMVYFCELLTLILTWLNKKSSPYLPCQRVIT